MEDFGARDWNADEFCRSKVAECDIFIAILGHRYGSCPEGQSQSFTEREFDAAVASERPRLVFVAPEELDFPNSIKEPDELRQRQKGFRQRVGRDCIYATFTSPGDLAIWVVVSLRNWERTHLQDHASGMPSLEPRFVNPHSLQRNFSGRAQERLMLKDWVVNGPTILCLVAIGGMGKSALAWAWLHGGILGRSLTGAADQGDGAYVPENLRPEGILWWSFEESQPSFAVFVNYALAYVSDGRLDPMAISSPIERVQVLIQILQKRRILIVLDGFERLLRSYATLSAAYRAESASQGEQLDFRSCTDPMAGRFLTWLAALQSTSRLLLTTRLFPAELDEVVGCRRNDLNGMTPEDAIVFFRSQGVHGTNAEIKAACAIFGYHPLTLRLLSGLILRNRRMPGDARVAQEYAGAPKLLQAKEHILDVAFETLSSDRQEILTRVAAFRGPISYEALTLFKTPPNGSRFDLLLDELEDRGLLIYDRDRKVYELHPVVRQYAYDRLTNKAETHRQLRDYFAAHHRKAANEVSTLEDLQPVIELYHHTLGCGRYSLVSYKMSLERRWVSHTR
jgi:hypothetical protein